MRDLALENKKPKGVILPFLRPNEYDFIRCQGENFLRGNTTSGNIGDFGWDFFLTGGIGYDNSRNPGGRAVCFATGTTSGNTSYLSPSRWVARTHTRRRP